MADARARLKLLHHRNAAWGNTEPIIHLHRALVEMEEEEELELSYAPFKHTEMSLSYTANATSHARSGS
jgi:hypothetical protein